MAILAVLLFMLSTIMVFFAPAPMGEPTRALPQKYDLSPRVVYHGAASTTYSGEACVQMVFDYHGPSVTQQDIRNVSTGLRDDGDVATSGELARAIHFSSLSLLSPTQRGYRERALGYGAFSNDWTNDRSDPSPRFASRWTDLMTAIYEGHPVSLMTYLDMPPVLGAPKPPDPQNPQLPTPPVGLGDLAALEKVWRLVVGYDNGGALFYVYDPLTVGTGFLGGGGRKAITRENLDKLWNITTLDEGSFKSHRVGLTGAPWKLADIKAPRTVEAGTTFTISVNVTYWAPPNMNGETVNRPQAVLDTPDEYSVEDSDTSLPLTGISGPNTFRVVEWTVRAPDRSYAGQDTAFYINASGTVISESQPRHTDSIGEGVQVKIEAFGFLNHPPVITTSQIDPALIPDDGTIQPLVSAKVTDEDGNIQTVQVDLTPIGGPSTQRMYDDGSNGDAVEKDGTYSYSITKTVQRGEHIIRITVKDTKGGKAYSNLTLVVEDAASFTEAPRLTSLGFTPSRAPNDATNAVKAWAIVTDKEDDLTNVEVDLSQVGGDSAYPLSDDGTGGDVFPLDGNYTADITIGAAVELGMYQIGFSAVDSVGHRTIATAWLEVVLPPVPPVVKSADTDPEEVDNDGKTKVRLVVVVSDDNDDIERVHTDLTPIKGMAETPLRNDGKGGDLAAGDDTWTLEFTVPTAASPGLKGKIDVTVVDMAGLEGKGSFTLRVNKANSAPEISTYSVRTVSGRVENEFAPGTVVVITVNASDPDSDVLSLTLNFTELPLADIPLLDDGASPDAEASDNVFSARFTIPSGTKEGAYNITVLAQDPKGTKDQLRVRLYVTGSGKGDTSLKLSPMVYIGVPVVLFLVLLVLFVLIFLKRTSPAKVRRGYAPPLMQQGMGRGQPPVFQPYVGPR